MAPLKCHIEMKKEEEEAAEAANPLTNPSTAPFPNGPQMLLT